MDKSSSFASTICPATLPGQYVTIIGRMTRSKFVADFVGRVRQIREALGKDPKEMAELMGVSLDKWRKYEKRTPLPHDLIPRFCRLTGVDIWYLFTGESASKAHTRPQVQRGAK